MTPENTFPTANDFFPPFSEHEMQSRRERVRAGMAEKGLDCLLVWGAIGFGTAAGQINLSWLSNYASIGSSYLVFPIEGTPALVLATPSHIRNARALTSGLDLRGGTSPLDQMLDRLRELQPKRIGLVGPYAGMAGVTLPHSHYLAVQAALPLASLEDVTHWYGDFQLIKSDEEIALMRRAGKLGDDIYIDVLAATKPGVTDAALRRIIAHRCIDAGATHPFSHVGSFATADPEDCYPDFYPTHTPIHTGDVLQTELCVGFGNYWNKIWATWFCGKPPQQYLELMALARETHDRVIGTLRAGLPCAEIDRLTEPLVARGLVPQLPLVVGWSAMNHGPMAGAAVGSRWYDKAQVFKGAAFEARQTLTIVVWLNVPGTKVGVWLGTSGVVAEGGFELFNARSSVSLHVA